MPLCEHSSECPQAEVCNAQHICEPVDPSLALEITAITGNNADDPSRVHNGLVIEGLGLGNATMVLADANGAIEATIYDQNNTRMEILLPADTVSGLYSLEVTNAAQTLQADVTLNLPEITPAIVLERLNSATGSIDVARLPVGAAAGTVAAGDHHHDSVYAPMVHTHALSDIQSDAASGEDLSLIPEGAVGIGLSDPSGVFQVGTGYHYVLQPGLTVDNTPRCGCDVDDASHDCGSADFVLTAFEGSECYDVGPGGNEHYITQDVASITVGDDGYVGIGNEAPQAALDVQGDFLQGQLRTRTFHFTGESTGGAAHDETLYDMTGRTLYAPTHFILDYVCSNRGTASTIKAGRAYATATETTEGVQSFAIVGELDAALNPRWVGAVLTMTLPQYNNCIVKMSGNFGP